LQQFLQDNSPTKTNETENELLCKRAQKGTLAPSGYYRYHSGRLRDKYVHVHVFEEEYGPLKPGEVVRHLCNNPWCVELTHLVRGSKKADIHDQLRSGTFNRQKLSVEQITEIRRLFKTTPKSATEIAKQFGIGERHVYKIVNGERWGKLES